MQSLRAALEEIKRMQDYFGDVTAVAKDRDAALSRATAAETALKEAEGKACAMREALEVIANSPHFSEFMRVHSPEERDHKFAEEVPEYGKDCDEIHSVTMKIDAALSSSGCPHEAEAGRLRAALEIEPGWLAKAAMPAFFERKPTMARDCAMLILVELRRRAPQAGGGMKRCLHPHAFLLRIPKQYGDTADAFCPDCVRRWSGISQIWVSNHACRRVHRPPKWVMRLVDEYLLTMAGA
jgi:hypothetical protein